MRGAGFCQGAWQVGLRYDWLDLNSGPIKGGQNQDVTLGLNWFLNPNARFQINYVLSYINNAMPYGTATNNPAGLNPALGPVGALAQSYFAGTGMIQTFGARMDFSF